MMGKKCGCSAGTHMNFFREVEEAIACCSSPAQQVPSPIIGPKRSRYESAIHKSAAPVDALFGADATTSTGAFQRIGS